MARIKRVRPALLSPEHRLRMLAAAGRFFGDRFPLWRALIGVVVTAKLLTGCAPDIRSANTALLSHLWSVELPVQFAMTGASTFGNEILVWSARDHAVLAVVNGRIVREIDALALGGRVLPVAAQRTDAGIEIIDRRGTLVVHADTGRPTFARLPIPGGARITAAAYSARGWLLATVEDSVVTIFVVQCSSPGEGAGPNCRDRRVDVWTVLNGGAPTSANIHLSAVGERILVTRVNPPFTALVVHRDGRQVALPAAPVPASNESRSAIGRPIWASLPMLLVKERFLQVLTDLRSDARMLIVRDSLGAVVRQTELQVPIGFVASDSNRGLVYGARAVEKNELIAYKVCGAGFWEC